MSSTNKSAWFTVVAQVKVILISTRTQLQ